LKGTLQKKLELYLEYMEKVKSIGLSASHHANRWGCKGSRGFAIITMSHEELNQGNLYILNNSEVVDLHITAHKEFLQVNQPKMTKNRCCKSVIRLS